MAKNNQTDTGALLEKAVRLHRGGELGKAEPVYRRVLQLSPDQPDALHLLGLIAQQRRQYTEAAGMMQRALRAAPKNISFLMSLGKLHLQTGHHTDAAGCFRKITKLEPDNSLGHFLLGESLRLQDDLSAAIQRYQVAVRVDPTNVDALNNLGAAYRAKGDFHRAIECFRQALRLRPEWVDGHNNLGMTLSEAGQTEEAVGCFETVIRLAPQSPAAYVNLGREYLVQGDLESAKDFFAEALKRDNRNVPAHDNLLICMNYDPSLSAQAVLDEHRRWAQTHVTSCAQRAAHANAPDPDRRLRIGYVSPDFYRHPISMFLLPVMQHHDHRNFEISCYSDTTIPDPVTRRFMDLCDHWREIVGMDHEKLAELVGHNEIDILVDLTGHMAENRLPTFARKPAPVQISWLGYPNTTGMDQIDYRFSDEICTPQGDEQYFTETLVRLESGFCCFAPPAEANEVSPSPSEATGHVTFGSLHNLIRLNGEVLGLWADVLEAVPDSHLLIFRTSLTDPAERRIRDVFNRREIDRDRVAFLKSPPDGGTYLSIYDRIDVLLDTFPWSGHTTACEAMWMGVPVITLRGTRTAGRMVAGALSHLGLSEFIAESKEHYVACAKRISNDRASLQLLRTTLRSKMSSSVLCDGKAFTAELERNYRAVWRKWCDRHRSHST